MTHDLVIVTGGTKGIGYATAALFAESAKHVLLTYRRDRESAAAAAAALAGRGAEILLVECDLSEDRAPLLDAVDRLGHQVSVLVANAAASAFKPLLEMKPHHVQKTMGVTVASYLELVQGLVPRMAHGSSIVAVSSGDTVSYIPGHGLLAGGKAAMEVLTRYLAIELAPHGIRANCVLPGPVATESARTWSGDAAWAAFADRVARSTPLGRIAEPEDIARVIRMLTGPDAAWINGQVVIADGGMFFADGVFRP